MEIIWGGRVESDGRRHGQYQAERRGITVEQIQQTIELSDSTTKQSIDCVRYFKAIAGKILAVVAIEKSSEVYEIITCYWR